MEKALELSRVSFQYKTGEAFALKTVSFSLDPGECAVVTGPSASGKTTLCQCLNGLIPQVLEGTLTGTVRVAGMDTAKFRVQTLSGTVGLVMQDPEVQIVGRTVFEDLAFGPRNFLVPAEEIRERVSDALARVGLDGYENRLTAALSGGEKQRLAIAGVLAAHPAILVLDEPASELDPEGRAALYRCLGDLRKSRGLTLVIVERQVNDIRSMADRILVMDKGRLTDQGRPGSGAVPPTPAGLPRPGSTGKKKDADPSPLALEATGLSFGYPRSGPVLKQIRLKIRQDDFIALMGHNGAGKTSLAKHLNGLLPCRPGAVLFYGKKINTLKTGELARSVGFVFQNPDHQIFETSVEKEVAFGLSGQGLSRTEIMSRVSDALCLTGLSAVRSHHPFALGKGERQLVAVASVVVLKPKVLIVDEPTTGLDARGTARIMEMFGTLHQNGTAVLLITHDLVLAATYADRLVVMNHGEITLDLPMIRALDNRPVLRAAGLLPGDGPVCAGQDGVR